MVFLDKYGFPVTQFKRRRLIVNTLRRLIHTRRIVRGWWDGYQVVPPGQDSPGPPVCSLPNNMQDLLVAGVVQDCPEAIPDPELRAKLMETHGPGKIKPGPMVPVGRLRSPK